MADHRAVAAISAGVIVISGGLLITISKSGHTPAFAARMSLPAQGGNLAEFSHLESVPARSLAAQKSTFVQSGPVAAPNRPVSPVLLIIRTAELSLTSREFGTVRRDIETVLRKYQGHIAQLNANTPSGQARSLDATLRIPAAQLDAALNELRRLGHVDSESQRGEEVTQRYTDIEAGLANARHTEQRLTAILQGRTPKLTDVLAVEEQLARVRGEIETTEAEQKSLANQIELGTVQLRVTEEFKQALEVGRTGLLTRVRNAAIEGIQVATDGVVGIVLWLLSTGPSLLLIGILLFFPLRWVWKHRTVERR